MSLRKTLMGVGLALGLVISFGAAAFAQQPQGGEAQQQQRQQGREGRRRGGPGGGEGFGMMRGLRDLNLSDAQQQQARAIFERFNASTKPQREQLMQLREQFEAGNAPADAQ